MGRVTTKVGDRADERPEAVARQADVLRTSIQRFVRSFGLLSAAQTPCGVPLALSHAHALMALLDRERHGDGSTQQDLVRLLGVDKSNVTRLVGKMIEAGQVAQEASPDDGRAWSLSLTAKGRRLAERVEEASRDRFGRLLAAIPPDARQAVIRSLELLNEAIAQTQYVEKAG